MFKLDTKIGPFRQNPGRTSNLGGPLRFFYKDRTRIHPGVRLTNQLDLHLGSKNPEKVCEVPNKNADLDKLDGQIITLHQRLALSAAHQSAGDSSVNNYVTINIGFVVSETPHAIVEKAQRRRKFITLPLRDPQFGVYWKYFKSRRAVHSEEVLYSYLSNEAPCTSLIDQLESKYGITPGFKIYALIIDMHSLNNVCKECTSLTYDNQFRDSFLQTIENILADRGYILPKVKLPCPDLLTPSQKRLHLVTRISSSRIFDSDNIEPFSEKEEILVPVFEDPIIVRDIKKFGNAVILKDTKQTPYKKVWSKDKDAITDTGSATVAFSNQTAFINFFSTPKWGRRQWCEKYTTSEEIIVQKLI